MSRLHSIAALIWLIAGTVLAQPGPNQPRIGYVYPAGGRQGSEFQAVVGGQRLGGAKSLHATGEGISATVKYYVRTIRNLDRDQRLELNQRLRERREELTGSARTRDRNQQRKAAKGEAKATAKTAAKSEATTRTTLAMLNQPILNDIEKLTLEELEFVEDLYSRDNRRQMNQQIADKVLLHVSIAPDAPAGDREIRLVTNAGLSNPMRFQVGTQPEIMEKEVRGGAGRTAATTETHAIPAIFNGQIEPGDVDRFRFAARRGQRLVVQVHARRLVPYLADAVPGWFQATLAIRDGRGDEIGFADDYQFDPDPVLLFRAPADGEYELEIRDSIYRGREDFVYRMAVGEQPFVTEVFPLGGRAGAALNATASGWNLPEAKISLDTRAGDSRVRTAQVKHGNWESNEILYAVDPLPDAAEKEPNDTIQEAQKLEPGRIVNGRIDKAGDADVFSIKGRAGDEIVVEVQARRLNSPLDGLLRITNGAGKVLALNDDCEDAGSGLLTHHADPRVRFKLPADGEYFIQLTDVRRHGGTGHAYRLRISAPLPDFELRVAPSTINTGAGRAVPIDVYALRRDGFDGEIEVGLKEGGGFTLAGSRIPAGCDRVRMTLQAPTRGSADPVALRFEGRAAIGSETVIREATPADDMMQAFIYRHLVPAQTTMVWVGGGRGRLPALARATQERVAIPAGGTAEIRLTAPRNQSVGNIRFELNDAPAGVTLKNSRPSEGGIVLEFAADAKASAGQGANLIVEAVAERPAGQKGGKGQNQRASLGVLPAIPFEITTR